MAQIVDLRAQVVNVKVTRGDRWALAVTWPGDLTGMEVRGQVRPEHESAESTPLHVQITDAAAGKFEYGQQRAEGGVYDIEIVTVGSELGRTWIKGKITTEQDVTRV